MKDEKRAVPPLGDFYRIVEREHNYALEKRQREQAEKVCEGIAKALRHPFDSEGGVFFFDVVLKSFYDFTCKFDKKDDVSVCFFDDHREILYVDTRSVLERGTIDKLNSLMSQRFGMHVDTISPVFQHRFALRSESPFPFLEELDGRITASADVFFSHARPAMYDMIIRRCCGEAVAEAEGGNGVGADMKHTISCRPFAFGTRRFREHLENLFNVLLASENLRVRTLSVKPPSVGSDLRSALDDTVDIHLFNTILTIVSLGVLLPVTGVLLMVSGLKKKRLMKEIKVVDSSVVISMNIECVSE